jgi:cytochrome c oxidase subunit 1
MSIPSSVLATGSARDISPGIYPGVVAYVAIAGVVLLLMILIGIVLRLAQAEWLAAPPDLFYEMMTAHGAGMVGIAGLAGVGIMWHFLSRYVRLSRGILIANLVSFLAGVAMILAAIFVGGFGGRVDLPLSITGDLGRGLGAGSSCAVSRRTAGGRGRFCAVLSRRRASDHR